MCLLHSSHGHNSILAAVDYVSRWVEAQARPTNDVRSVVKFLNKLFSRFAHQEKLYVTKAPTSATHSLRRF